MPRTFLDRLVQFYIDAATFIGLLCAAAAIGILAGAL